MSNLSDILAPKFEGFAIKTSQSVSPQRLLSIIATELDQTWHIEAFTDTNTDFEIANPDVSLSVGNAWETTYRLRKIPEVVYAEPLFAVSIDGRPDWSKSFSSEALNIEKEKLDQAFDKICGFDSPHLPGSEDCLWSLKEIKVIEAWERFFPNWQETPPGQDVIIGHPDTGYQPHSEIIDNLLLDGAFDYLDKDQNPLDESILNPPNGVNIRNPGHGTATSSVIISPLEKNSYINGIPSKQSIFKKIYYLIKKLLKCKPKNKEVVSGVSPGTKLIPFRTSYSVVLSPQSVWNLAHSIRRAVKNGADIISISMGAVQPFSWYLWWTIRNAQKQGVIILAAAGNCTRWVVAPASFDEVIGVAGSNINHQPWKGSSFGSKVDVAAPGESVWHAFARKGDNNQILFGVDRGSGTSFAVALTAGVAALWLAHHGGRKALGDKVGGVEKIPFIFQAILVDNCTELPGWDTKKFGKGIINAEATLAAKVDDYTEDKLINFNDLEQDYFQNNSSIDIYVNLFKETSNSIQSALTELLNTRDSKLQYQLSEIGQELAFNFAINPKLYKKFKEYISNKKSSNFIGQIEELRALISSSDISNTLESNISLMVNGKESNR